MCVLFCVRVSTRLWMSECVWNEGGICCCCSLGRLKKSTKRQVKTGNRRRSGITKEDKTKNQRKFWWGGPCVDGESEIAGLRRWQRWNGDSMAARSASSALVDGRRPCRDVCPFLQSKFWVPPPPSSTYPSFKRIRLFYCLVFFVFKIFTPAVLVVVVGLLRHGLVVFFFFDFDTPLFRLSIEPVAIKMVFFFS